MDGRRGGHGGAARAAALPPQRRRRRAADVGLIRGVATLLLVVLVVVRVVGAAARLRRPLLPLRRRVGGKAGRVAIHLLPAAVGGGVAVAHVALAGAGARLPRLLAALAGIVVQVLREGEA